MSYILCHWGIQLILAYSWARPAILVAGKGREVIFYCPPPFRRKVEGHCFWFSVGRGAWPVARGAWFRVFSRYFVPLTPPTVSVRSF